MSKLRLWISVSLDGFVAGPAQDADNPLGVGGMRLHEWVFPLAAWRQTQGLKGGEVNESSRVIEAAMADIGATVMGRNMFGGGTGPWGDNPWNGWWGDNPPYHHPVFVLTHHPREPLVCSRTSASATRGCPIAARWQRQVSPTSSSGDLARRPPEWEP